MIARSGSSSTEAARSRFTSSHRSADRRSPGPRLTDGAIERIRDLIRSGELPPGSRLPPERKLAEQLGLSRNSMREAVKALETVPVLDSRPGDGTYVTSLAPRLLLEGFGAAIDLLQDDGGSTDLRTSCEKTYPSGGQQAEG